MQLVIRKAVQLLETTTFTSRAVSILTHDELDALHGTLAYSPEIGSLIRGTGGVRKYRMSTEKQGKGKSGGARVIYYYGGEASPLALLAIFTKGEKENLSQDDKKILKRVLADFYRQYKT